MNSIFEWWTAKEISTGLGDIGYSVVQYRRIRKRPMLVRNSPGLSEAVASFSSPEAAERFCTELGLNIVRDDT